MTVAIIDDENPAIALLTAYIQRTEGLLLRQTFNDPLAALTYYNLPDPPELTFLDIDLPGISGVEFARIVGPKTRIILTTSFREYGPEAFELSVYDYLLKPFSYERFLGAVAKAMITENKKVAFAADHFFVRTEARGKYLQNKKQKKNVAVPLSQFF
jgi:two-component system LytT family response regulator